MRLRQAQSTIATSPTSPRRAATDDRAERADATPTSRRRTATARFAQLIVPAAAVVLVTLACSSGRPESVPSTAASASSSNATAATSSSSPASSTAPATGSSPVSSAASKVAPTIVAVSESSAPISRSDPTCSAKMVGGARPVAVYVPATYSCRTAAPLVIALHGYTSSSTKTESYFQLRTESDARGFLYLAPDGTKDRNGAPFWNATDGCCNFYGSTVDDSTYLSELINEMSIAYNVDPKRVYLVGHSNGGFMSYRMACDHGSKIAAIASLAGAMWIDNTNCPATSPVSVLQIHGTSDTVISPEGGRFTAEYPSAITTVTDWATTNGCDPSPERSGAPLDLELDIAGTETTVSTYRSCHSGTGVELWSVQSGSHSPRFSPAFTSGVLNFFYAHPKA
jgi:polyhydroxybutyrate depolymerase